MKETLKFKLFAIMLAVCIFCMSLVQCKQDEPVKQTDETTNDVIVASNDAFKIKVGNEVFEATNESLYDEPLDRGIKELDFVVDYFVAIADGVLAGIDIAKVVKDEKLTTFVFWTKLIPATLPHTKTLFNAGKKAILVKELYANVGKLTDVERMAISLRLKGKYPDISLWDAERLTSLILQWVLLDAQIVYEIKKLKK
jgi:hypothetical protein